MGTIVARGIAWVQEQLAKINAEQDAIEAGYEARAEAIAAEERRVEEARRPKPRPQAPAVVTDRARQRLVLVVGINDYGGKSNLRGCLTDAKRWGALYRAGGWQVLTLLDRETAGDSILGALAELAGRCEPGDELGWVCSSHGTRIPDRNDPTGEVAAVCPADIGDDSSPDWFGDRCITHLEVGEIVRALPPRVPFHGLIDACHSGIPSTSLISARALGDPTAPAWTPRYLAPPHGVLNPIQSSHTHRMSRNVVTVDGLRSLVLAGCAPEQTSADAYLDGSHCGAFSWALQRAARNQTTGASIAELMRSASAMLRLERFDQVPWLEGDSERLKGPAPWAPLK